MGGIGKLFLALFLMSSNLSFAGFDQQSTNWEQNWEQVAVSSLPTLVPDGKMADFQLALRRQKQSCREFREGKFTVCPNESDLVQLVCDDAVIDRLLTLTQTSKNWTELYNEAKKSFDWFRFKATPKPNNVLFTGYNAPLFQGSLTANSKEKYPIYNRPSDLADVRKPDGTIDWKKRLPDGSLVPYDDRKAIDVDRILAGKNLEVAWFEYPSDILRLQIEGSGILEVRMSDGSKKNYTVNYAGKNGLLFQSPFTYMRNKGVDKKYLTFPGMKQYFIDFPDEMWPTLTYNPAYVFFTVGTEPPCGTGKVHLTGGHTLAVDPTVLPLGSVAFFEARRPIPGSDPNLGTAPTEPFTRFAMAQDTGGPIKGGHVDVYWGTDDYAQLASNLMATRGTWYFMKMKR